MIFDLPNHKIIVRARTFNDLDVDLNSLGTSRGKFNSLKKGNIMLLACLEYLQKNETHDKI